jgi:carboxyl-terminal processing protease
VRNRPDQPSVPWLTDGRRRFARIVSVLLMAGGLSAIGYALLVGSAQPGGTRPVPAAALGPPPAADPAAVIDDAIGFMRQRALARDRVDWNAARAEALHRVRRDGASNTGRAAVNEEHALDEAALDAALENLVERLGDRHSFYLPRAGQAAVSAPLDRADPTALARLEPAVGEVPRLALLTFWPTDPEVNAAAARHLRRLLVTALDEHPCGLVIDLSTHRGGTVWPMLQGLLPLLSQGVLGGFEAVDGTRTLIDQAEGSIRHAGRRWYPADPVLPNDGRKPRAVALLTSARTGSAAETVLVMFMGQDGVRRFGQPTAGLTTVNTPRALAHGGAIAIATHRSIDRSGRHVEGPIAPDVDTGVFGDTAAARAADWVRARCADRAS